MNPGVLRRVLTMDGQEVRFRTSVAARRLFERTTTLIAPPHWRRESLLPRLRGAAKNAVLDEAKRALRKRDWFSAHELLGRYFAARSHFPVTASALDQVAPAVRSHFPNAESSARTRGNRILKGAYDLLGYSGLRFGTTPDWHFDPVSGQRAPREFWADVRYLDPSCGDHKVTWELNRHQHWLQLGVARTLTGERAYYERFVRELESWLASNPPLIGTNWASMLEVSLRSISWLWAIQFFSPLASKSDPYPWMVDLLSALDRQLEHVSRNLSRYFSPNTHLTGEGLGLYAAGRTLPELRGAARWATLGATILVDETRNQLAADGGHAELSAHYHRYSTDFYLFALLLSRKAGDGLAGVFEPAARAQAEYLRVICDDNGYRPGIGDDDGGQLFPICGRPSEDCRATLSHAATMLADPSLAIDDPVEETYWFCGCIPEKIAHLDRRRWPSTILRHTGYHVSRTPSSDHLLFDVGPHGYLNCGHAHADALSITLTVAGRPVLIDPGTGTYTTDPMVRDRFRSTAMHNTLMLNRRPQSEPNGPFHWKSSVSAHTNVSAIANRCDYFEGSHDGYGPLVHARGVLVIHDLGWLIVDTVPGDAVAFAEVHWHLHPSWKTAARHPSAIQLSDAQKNIDVISSEPMEVLGPDRGGDLSDVSLVYGRIEPSRTLRASIQGPTPFGVLTCIDPSPDASKPGAIERSPITKDPGLRWSGSAFRITIGGGQMILLAAVETDGVAGAPDAAPGRVWGCADLMTDARLACLITKIDGRAEAVLVNGSRLETGDGQAILELPSRAQLIRIDVPSMAHLVHSTDH